MNVIWDLTYACPARCVHCWTESGRRPGRELDRTGTLRVADAIASLHPAGVTLAGGEPLVVPDVFVLARRLAAAGIPVALRTGGGPLTPALVAKAEATLAQIVVGVDGATAATHDRISGREGSFEAAVRALALLDDAARRARSAGRRVLPFGIDFRAVRGNLAEVEAMCADFAGRFPELSSLTIGPGFGSRLDDSEVDALCSPSRVRGLRALAPPLVHVSVADDRVAALPVMFVEPDGAVRTMPVGEGPVGNLLDDSERWGEPLAARLLDLRFGAPWRPMVPVA